MTAAEWQAYSRGTALTRDPPPFPPNPWAERVLDSIERELDEREASD